MAQTQISSKAAPVSFQGVSKEFGQDVLAVNELTTQLVERARKGEGPFFIELKTYRYHGHHVGDINRGYYRTKEEEEDWKTARDPITNFGAWLVQEQIVSADALSEMADAIRADAEAAVAYALEAPYPPAAEVDAHVYAS